ncbi:hypothetical protein SLEP1_g55308 [Rubroshorea leprosula]|uniref:Uncharacterized protein n=1 Tax=Rubroshorea leprosula TaxID=152421 RepID=A0AAV5MFV9_9ROSI|nr:hypothetical protein SLEP1_g55308 [Rubroshorea leprosula]
MGLNIGNYCRLPVGVVNTWHHYCRLPVGVVKHWHFCNLAYGVKHWQLLCPPVGGL